MLEADPELPVPLRVRLILGRAAVQVIADRAGVDLLHIKGNAVDSTLREASAVGTDIDILVEPRQVALLDHELRRNGWRVYSTFEWGSPFEHAQTYVHGVWGFLDLHRRFPGIRAAPEHAFAVLGAGSTTSDFAGTACRVPGVVEQAAILVLNAARGGAAVDMQSVWWDATPERRDEIVRVIHALDARVAFGAATGDLERYRDERDYRLWKIVSGGGPRSAEWWARVRAAPTPRESVRIVWRAPLVNVEHLSHRIGRSPTRREIVTEFFARPARAVRELWLRLSRGVQGTL